MTPDREKLALEAGEDRLREIRERVERCDRLAAIADPDEHHDLTPNVAVRTVRALKNSLGFLTRDARFLLSALTARDETIARLTRERDEADRRAGSAERSLESLRDQERKRDWWMRDRKRELGYHENVSFDQVWADTLAKAERTGAAEARLAVMGEALRPFADESRRICQSHLGSVPDEEIYKLELPVGALHAARAALEQEERADG